MAAIVASSIRPAAAAAVTPGCTKAWAPRDALPVCVGTSSRGSCGAALRETVARTDAAATAGRDRLEAAGRGSTGAVAAAAASGACDE
jgi:hypothetical protein